MWLLLAFLSAVFAAATALLSKAGVKQVNCDLVTALRTAVVLVLAWLMVFLTVGMPAWGDISDKTYLFLFLSGLSTGLSWLCYFRALSLGDVNKVTPVDKTSTALTVLLAFLLLGEQVNWHQWGAVVLITGGVLLMIQKKKATADGKRGWLPYAVGSAVFAALTTILAKAIMQDVSGNLATALRTIVVLAMAWGIVLAKGKQKELPFIPRKSWLFILASGLTTGASWLCYFGALKQGPAFVVASVDKSSVVLTVLLSGIFLKEKLTGKAVFGLCLLTAGTIIMIL